MTEWTKIILFILILCFTEARYSVIQFMAVNDCTCRGYNVTYECTVFGGGATVWKGTAFDCSLSDDEFLIFQTSQSVHTCNNGAITGRIVRAENDSYTSQLNVHISNDTGNNATVVCAHDTGTESIEIGSAILNITKVPFPPPTDVQLVEEDLTHLSFNWTHVSLNCPSIQYQIMASNCGECPDTTSNNMVTCNGNYTQLMHNQQCSLAVRTVVCEDLIGDVSIAIRVPMIGAESDIEPTNSKTSSSDSYDATVSSPVIVITLGAVIGVMFIVITFLILLFTTTTTILLKSKRALGVQLNILQDKVKEPPVIYEEIAQLQDSLKSSSPTIDVGENTAYVSAVSMNACVRVST